MLSIDGLKYPTFVVPPKPLVQILDAVLRNLLGNSESRQQESETIAAIRDTLLPELVSGMLYMGETDD